MKIVVTGSNGFVGRNLVQTLRNTTDHTIYEIERETSETAIDKYLEDADFIYHLAGVNRPEHDSEFIEGNKELISEIIEKLESYQNYPPILFTSSIQAESDNPYGKSKKAGERIVQTYGERNNVATYIYRLPNLFGKWSRPNYNSVVATFCYKIARDEAIQVNDPEVELTLAYIDDVLDEFLSALAGSGSEKSESYDISITHNVRLGHIVELIKSFKAMRENRMIPDMSDPFTKKLYSTYLSYLPEGQFSYPLVMHKDDRGSFTEFIKSPQGGQVSVNISKPGVTKGEHWHHTKNEKFLVVKGKGVIKFRNIYSEEVIEYFVSDEKLEVVDIPVGYTHSIINTGNEDMVTIMWVNELFDSNNPDTYFLEV